jgi:hypothetical protein
VGGIAAISAVLVGIIETGIQFLPVSAVADVTTVVDWFTLLQENTFMGLRNLGLLNIFLTILGVPLYVALYGALKRKQQAAALLAAIIAFIGAAVFFSTNRAFPMLDLSNQYAVASSDAQRAALEAVGQALLVVGASHSPGTFLAFFLNELAGLIVSLVMLRSGVFNKLTAWLGIVGFGCLMVFDINSTFFLGTTDAAIMFATFGGLLSMAWYIIVALRFFKLAAEDDSAANM